MKNIHILPTSQPSRLVTQKYYKGLCLADMPTKRAEYKRFNIYITSDEEIKDCWFLNIFNGEIGFIKNSIGIQKNAKKIILTTDQDLIKDGVQAIPDEFLEWFVINPTCENVEVNKVSINCSCAYQSEHRKNANIIKENTTCHLRNNCEIGYRIIIPKEEPKQETIEEVAKDYALKSFIPMKNSEGEILTIPPNQTVPCGFRKHEKVAIKHFTDGYNHAVKTLYTEEEMKESFIKGALTDLWNTWDISDIDMAKEKFTEWFNQNKKK